MKCYWRMLQVEQNILWGKIGEMERKMSKLTKIKDLEFFMSDNECVGIGQYDREMKLIQREELE